MWTPEHLTSSWSLIPWHVTCNPRVSTGSLLVDHGSVLKSETKSLLETWPFYQTLGFKRIFKPCEAFSGLKSLPRTLSPQRNEMETGGKPVHNCFVSHHDWLVVRPLAPRPKDLPRGDICVSICAACSMHLMPSMPWRSYTVRFWWLLNTYPYSRIKSLQDAFYDNVLL